MRDHQRAAVLRELGQAAALDAKKFHDLLQAALDLTVHLFRRQINEER